MIARNYRQHPEALALQLPLPFGRALVWALARPGARALRAIRAARAAAFKAAGRVAYPVPVMVPQWVYDKKRRARDLALMVKKAMGSLPFNQEEPEPTLTVAERRRLMTLEIIEHEEASGDPELIEIATWRRRVSGIPPRVH